MSVIAPGGGEIVGDAPERRVEILADHESLHATWTRFGPHREGAELHVHRHHSDLFYVLEGELTLRLGVEGEEAVVGPGTLARVPPLVVHGFANRGDADVRYLNLHAPGAGFADYMRGLRDGRTVRYDQEPPPAAGTRPIAEAVIGGAEPVSEHALLLADVDAIAITREQGDPSALHVHRRHAESLYVLEGELALVLGERELHAPAGAWVHVAPGVPHALGGHEPVRYLAVHTPSRGYGAFLRGDAGAGFDHEPVALWV